MDIHSLNGIWNLKIIGKDSKLTTDNGIEASVPGSVYGILLKNGIIDDPYYRDNELKVLPLMDNDFLYSTEFTISKEDLEKDSLILRFDGVDTLAKVMVNDVEVGVCENMHRFYEFELLGDPKEEDAPSEAIVHEGANSLKVLIYSPTKYIKEENEKCYTGGARECMEGFPHIRKAHCMFGWDWGPRIPDAGIYRGVSILGINKARIDSVYISQEINAPIDDYSNEENRNHPNGEAILSFNVDVESYCENDTCVTIKVASPDGNVYTAEDDDAYTIVVANPYLWWPNGYGKQSLYKVSVSLLDVNGEVLDTWEKNIGIRSLTMNTDKDEYGECFAHEINGVKIFAMGADYIPEDNILERVTKERTRALLEDAIAANHNSIRVWGGGYYLDDYFYDICDELGLIVWQDFMFACAAYELTEEFEENIIEETRQVVKRLRHHASLGLWCGNNELETQVLDGAWKHNLKQKGDYTKMFEYIIPKICKEEDPQRFYWPSSPSSGGNWDNPWDDTRGDVHYWDVWHGEKPFTDYRNYKFRYLSEFGFQSFPSIATVNTFTEPEDQNIFSYVMEMHQRNVAANGKILKYISDTYQYPKNFEMLLYTSQLLQADAIRYGVEHFRRYRGQCMGAVVWQLNDIWPVASWASIDYYGRWKALHYAEKRMFAPIMISCEEEGDLTQRPFCILEPSNVNYGAKLHVANETFEDIKGTIKWALRDECSNILTSGEIRVNVSSLSGSFTEYLDFNEYDPRRMHLEYSFVKDGEESVISSNTVLFIPPKHYMFADPKLSFKVDKDSVIISASAFAKNVYIEGEDGDILLEDNFFDMEKGERRVRIIKNTATKFKIMSVYDIN